MSMRIKKDVRQIRCLCGSFCSAGAVKALSLAWGLSSLPVICWGVVYENRNSRLGKVKGRVTWLASVTNKNDDEVAWEADNGTGKIIRAIRTRISCGLFATDNWVRIKWKWKWFGFELWARIQHIYFGFKYYLLLSKNVISLQSIL